PRHHSDPKLSTTSDTGTQPIRGVASVMHQERFIRIDHKILSTITPLIDLIIIRDRLVQLIRTILDEIDTRAQAPKRTRRRYHFIARLTLFSTISAFRVYH